MAIQAGLTMAIANPSQELLVNTAFASDLLMNKEGGDIRYIERMNDYQPRIPATAVPAKGGSAVGNIVSGGGASSAGDMVSAGAKDAA